MASADARIIVENTIYYGEYSGTSDRLKSKFYDNEIECNENWKTDYGSECQCTNPDIKDATFEHDYGGGYRWNGTVCLICKCVIEGREY